jgi:peptidoglycan/xylan/chitin deacetylase (PgdA/CDA1 family)
MTPSTQPIAVPILLYHSVNERPAAGQEQFTVTPAAFCEHMRAVAESGRTAITVRDYVAFLRGERALTARPVLITFDDGFADTRVAVEQLLGAGLGATVFVTSGLIGREGMLTPAGVRGLAHLGDGVELGAHSVTHPRLDELEPGRAREEIRASRTALEEIADTPIDSFAYPHGAYDRRVREMVVNAGFTAGAAVKNALSHSRDDPFALARVSITARTQARQVEALLSGSGARIARSRERLRTRGYRAARRLRRRTWAVTA